MHHLAIHARFGTPDGDPHKIDSFLSFEINGKKAFFAE
jgi:hypothetical protein